MKSSERYVYTTKSWDDPPEPKTAFTQVVEHDRLTQALWEIDRLGGLVEHLPEGICLLDSERRVTLTNPTAQECLYALAGKGVGEVLTHLGDRPIDEVLAEVLLISHDGLTCEVKVPDSPRVFEITARPITSRSALGEWVMVVREATRHREAQGRIQQQERLASMGQLALGVAHDFNNLLTVMVSIAQMLERRPDTSAEGREMLRSLVSQGLQGALLIGQLLDFSCNIAVQRQPVDLVPFLKETAKSLGRVLPEDLRISTAYLPQAEKLEARPLLPEVEIPRGNGEVILVVEDQILVRETTKAMLEYLNYRVVTTRVGREALKAYSAHRDKIALVLTDMVMAEMGGRELAEILKESNPKIQLVVMSGSPLGNREETQLLPGVAGMLQKPLILEQLAQVISEAIQRRSTRPGPS